MDDLEGRPRILYDDDKDFLIRKDAISPGWK